jgi:hypothetical protein
MLIEATSDLATRINGAIRDAARATGASFDYLLKTTLRESNLNPGAQTPTSSATGLFQFIDQTWRGTLKRSGVELGYGNFADPEPVPLPRPKAARVAHSATALAPAKAAGASDQPLNLFEFLRPGNPGEGRARFNRR